MCGVQLKGPLDMYGSAKGPLDMYGSVGGPLGQWTCMVQLEGPLDMYGSAGVPLGHVWFSWRAPWTCMVQLEGPLDMCYLLLSLYQTLYITGALPAIFCRLGCLSWCSTWTGRSADRGAAIRSQGVPSHSSPLPVLGFEVNLGKFIN